MYKELNYGKGTSKKSEGVQLELTLDGTVPAVLNNMNETRMLTKALIRCRHCIVANIHALVDEHWMMLRCCIFI